MSAISARMKCDRFSLAVQPDLQGRGLGSFVLEQAQHLARLRGCTHIVLEVAENNPSALEFYRKRGFQKLDAAVFLAKKMLAEPELLPARALKSSRRVKQRTLPDKVRGA
jgi:ribosomal protein S18 acetylase RimI-like enzyme